MSQRDPGQNSKEDPGLPEVASPNNSKPTFGNGHGGDPVNASKPVTR